MFRDCESQICIPVIVGDEPIIISVLIGQHYRVDVIPGALCSNVSGVLGPPLIKATKR